MVNRIRSFQVLNSQIFIALNLHLQMAQEPGAPFNVAVINAPLHSDFVLPPSMKQKAENGTGDDTRCDSNQVLKRSLSEKRLRRRTSGVASMISLPAPKKTDIDDLSRASSGIWGFLEAETSECAKDDKNKYGTT